MKGFAIRGAGMVAWMDTLIDAGRVAGCDTRGGEGGGIDQGADVVGAA
jgi:hypothetical protein